MTATPATLTWSSVTARRMPRHAPTLAVGPVTVGPHA
jgi:hypothetical protein